MPEPGIAEVNPAAMLIQLEALGRRAHKLDEQLCELGEYARQHGDLGLVLKLRRCAGATRRASAEVLSDDLHDAVRAAAIFLPLPKSTAGQS
jgi:hypothetical protein